MNRKTRAFTLIELMIVVTIIGVLIMMLVPAVSTAWVAVRIRAATQHVAELDVCIHSYLEAYGDYPPSTPNYVIPAGLPAKSPTWRNEAAGDVWAKPNYKPLLKQLDIASGSTNEVQFDVTQGTILGGGLLNYFLMGPTGNGWDPQIFFCRHCGASKGISGWASFTINGCNYIRGGTAANICYSNVGFLSGTVLWVPPPAVEMLVGKDPIATYNNGAVVNAPFYYLEDGFPVGGNCPFGGTIQYVRARRGANPYDVATARCDITGGLAAGNVGIDVQTAADRSTTVGRYGTGISGASFARLLGQCKAPYALISSGPDRLFGYYSLINNEYVQDATNGQCDDITSFPHD